MMCPGISVRPGRLWQGQERQEQCEGQTRPRGGGRSWSLADPCQGVLGSPCMERTLQVQGCLEKGAEIGFLFEQ
jgi:hypothetical protein